MPRENDLEGQQDQGGKPPSKPRPGAKDGDELPKGKTE
jgi:hypothetical protein